jgi:hypothetical protein
VGQRPPGNRNHILTEEIKIKLQRGGTYTLPNQRLGNEGDKQREKQQLKQQQSNTTRKAKEQ